MFKKCTSDSASLSASARVAFSSWRKSCISADSASNSCCCCSKAFCAAKLFSKSFNKNIVKEIISLSLSPFLHQFFIYFIIIVVWYSYPAQHTTKRLQISYFDLLISNNLARGLYMTFELEKAVAALWNKNFVDNVTSIL